MSDYGDRQKAEALKALGFWHGLFVIFCLIVGALFLLQMSMLINTINAANECIGVDDRHFKQCYEAAKK